MHWLRTFAIVAFLDALLLGALPTSAQWTQPEVVPQISVTGTSEIHMKPDALSIAIGVESFGDAHVTVMSSNSSIVTKVLAAAKDLGVEAADTFTSRISLTSQDNNERRRFYASNVVIFTIRDIDRADEFTAAMITAGANNIRGIKPILNPDERILERLRKEAIVKARAAAEQSVAAAGGRLGRVLRIHTSTKPQTDVFRYGASTQLAEVPIEAGTVLLSVSVSINWAIE